jgi:two-component system chemotaxis sensor kinase CheA
MDDISASEGYGSAVTYRIRFVPEQDLFLTGTNPVALLSELASLGEYFVFSNMSYVPTLDKYDPEYCYTYWDIVLVSEKGIDSIRDVFIFVEGHCRLSVEIIDEDVLVDRDREYKKLGEVLIERGDLTSEELERVLSEHKSLGQELIGRELIDSGKIESALLEQKVVRDDRIKRHTADTATSIRVTSEKLDNLVNLVGELVTAQARLSQTAYEKSDPEIVNIAEVIELLTWELRDTAFSIRMLPIGSTFSKYTRLVRDLSSEMGKEVNLITEGGETELDKTVIEKLNDPLTHLIRNCIDHGLEDPEKREADGKSRCGTITLSAHHSGADVLIKISDDGSGLDESSIRKRAIEKGLIPKDADIRGSDIYSVIFSPGFSTAARVSSISGRGVGLDIVKKYVEALRGSVEVESEKGAGTTVTIRLPLTLAIIEGLQVDVRGEKYIIPMSMVDECVELKSDDIERAHGRHMASVRGEIIPYIRLNEWFSIDGETPDIEQIVITDKEGFKVGFVVDYVVGEHQTVIKTLGKVYSEVEGIMGATILGDGSVSLILDIPRLVQIAQLFEGTGERNFSLN